MYFEAYKKANLATETPAQTEYRLFAEITRELENANLEKSISPTRVKAVYRNSQLWLTLRIDLASEENKLDVETKAGLMSLAIWVDKFTAPAMRQVVDLEPLITVNKEIMQGLSTAGKTNKTAPEKTDDYSFDQISI